MDFKRLENMSITVLGKSALEGKFWRATALIRMSRTSNPSAKMKQRYSWIGYLIGALLAPCLFFFALRFPEVFKSASFYFSIGTCLIVLATLWACLEKTDTESGGYDV